MKKGSTMGKQAKSFELPLCTSWDLALFKVSKSNLAWLS